VANVLRREKQIEVLRLLVEGNSIRSTERLTGIHRDTIMRLVRRFGDACRSFLDESLAHLSLRHVQCDEIWTFVKKKQGHLRGNELRNDRIGDQYLYTALDTDTKLIASFTVGKRSSEMTYAFIADLEKRLVRQPLATSDSPQISTDGWGPYVPAIARSFVGSVRHGVLIKQYVNPESGRYAPPNLVKTERHNVQGIRDLTTICTSHVERNNGTIRQWCKRFTRLTYAFSKRVENLAAAVALHVAFYNYCRIHRTLRCTPAMAAFVTDRLWSMGDLYDAVTEHAERKRKDERLAKLARKLRERDSRN
jgi:IS1 family transposase